MMAWRSISSACGAGERGPGGQVAPSLPARGLGPLVTVPRVIVLRVAALRVGFLRVAGRAGVLAGSAVGAVAGVV
ncbi:MAG TPA: hypothetical protein VKU77_12810, partial [Streptosporangiaceae bacterium]|nr:hypothetical protein [Streptosporangiaceae bacterium]